MTKGEVELKRKKEDTQREMNALKTQYGNLHQIDRQSAEGNYIHERIEKCKGWIEAINWMLND